MHLAFIDIVTSYDADRPDQDGPLGGTTSAVCFLAREMVKAGHACTLFNKIRQERWAHGVRSLPLEKLIHEGANPSYTAFIFCGRWVEWLPKMLQENSKAPLIAWMHESTFEPQLVPALSVFSGVAFVSEWQKRVNQPHVQAHWKQVVLRNAMNPRALELFAPGDTILASKARPPVLLYAGATPRGAFHMPPLLDALRLKQNDFTVEIYCDCTPSFDVKANADYIKWMRGLPNVTHVGMVGQTELMQKMKRAAFMISPNPWPETSCIALIEAMAAGLSVITTNRAVLPETAAGFARHVMLERPDDPIRFDMPLPYEEFADTVSSAMERWAQNPGETEKKLQDQVAYFATRYQWWQRVQPWTDFINSFA
ncbi:MAG: glycosyltransferase [Pseudomonadota bacterium]|nr:glycosyltransferase [Pseudomonadota bacterium]